MTPNETGETMGDRDKLQSWNVTPAEAREIQRSLADRVELIDAISLDDIHVVVGIDNGYIKRPEGTTGYAAAVAFTFPELESIETVIGSAPVSFPYIPGLLSFREAPAVMAAMERLTVQPDVILFDGQGYAHPRRIGFASHMGVVLGCPSVGCAKSRLIGTFGEPANEFGAWTPLIDHDEVIGAAVRTRVAHSPLFVSPGTKVSVEGAVAITLACCRDNRFMPIPTRAAHNAVTAHTKPLRKK
jgi:deoxyribonuclease V